VSDIRQLGTAQYCSHCDLQEPRFLERSGLIGLLLVLFPSDFRVPAGLSSIKTTSRGRRMDNGKTPQGPEME
jgi:hypothetical protein